MKKLIEGEHKYRSISALSGRYYNETEPLQEYFSEFALNRARLNVEIEWLIFYCEIIGKSFKTNEINDLRLLVKNYDGAEHQQIKNLEKETAHDIKAVEYYIHQKLALLGLSSYKHLVHFGITSEDVNSTAYGSILNGYVQHILLPKLNELHSELAGCAKQWKKIVMLSRTHGQISSPTTLGKEIGIFATRLAGQIKQLQTIKIYAKFSGTVGNYNALAFINPEIDWQAQTELFLGKFDLSQDPASTQIVCREFLAELCHNQLRINNIMLGLCVDLWSYISLDYLKLKLIEGEVGSSTMPHKLNPIKFEMAEGNLGLANSLLNFFSSKLVISRMQRDLSDSTVLRNIGLGFGHSFLAYNSIISGLKLVSPNNIKINAELDSAWEVLAEPLQLLLRAEGHDGYNKLKELTRGVKLDEQAWKRIIEQLKLPQELESKIAKLNPQSYYGYSTK